MAYIWLGFWVNVGFGSAQPTASGSLSVAEMNEEDSNV